MTYLSVTTVFLRNVDLNMSFLFSICSRRSSKFIPAGTQLKKMKKQRRSAALKKRDGGAPLRCAPPEVRFPAKHNVTNRTASLQRNASAVTKLLRHCCPLLWLAVVLAANGKNRTRFYLLAERHPHNGTCVALRCITYCWKSGFALTTGAEILHDYYQKPVFELPTVITVCV